MYYEVLVASPRYHGEDALTYEFAEKLTLGQIVSVPLQRQKVVGVVSKVLTAKPAFNTKPIEKVVTTAALPTELVELITWLRSYYPAPLGSLLQLLLPSTLLQASRTPFKPKTTKPAKLPALTKEQQSVATELRKHPVGMSLLHGDTGTGKTRVYLELAQKTLATGRSVIVLTPEIGLTPQLAASFQETFPKVVVLHSNLTPAERRKRWLRVLDSEEPLVVLGPRSALFAPLHSVGLIILDEAHDQAYKQEQQPYYQTSRVAAVLGQLHKAQVILGTATPLVADYYTFSQKKLPVIRMQQQAIATTTDTNIQLVEISDRANFSRSPHLSNVMLEAINATITRGEQSLVFLNRRGTARLVLCEQCGWTALCPRCDLSLTYHGDSHEMHCHVCNYSESAPSRCPSCGHTDISYRSIGTKTIVTELEKIFPHARIRRFDTDLKKGERLEEAYESIKKGEVDIIVGTQMLAKGLDLPSLGLVGVVAADTSLFIPDFTAEEHTYQLLSQIIGRVGRGHRHGTVIIQTYHPENTALQAAITKDYAAFYDRQVAERETFRFPPFAYLLKLQVSRATEAGAEKAADHVARVIQQLNLPVELAGPSPAFHTKTHGKYHWQLIIKSRQRAPLVKIIENLPANTSYDIDPTSLV
jgi:primosomal protein N' (replication factor Y)